MTSFNKETAEKCIEDNIKRFRINELRSELTEIARLIAHENDKQKKSALIKKQKEIYEKLKMFDGR